VGKGFSRVHTPLFEGMIMAQQDNDIANEGAANVAVDDDKIAQSLEITKLKQRVKKLERRNKLKVSKLRRLKRVETSQSVDTSDDTVMDDKLDEDVAELKRHLQIVPNDEDDVYTEATPLARKVPIVDYEIYTENNKPYYKIIRADGSPQLFLSFLSLLRNFDREDLEVLWQLVKERFLSSKPKNFLDDFMLTTLTYMFEKPDV
nr:hypothetical protein [Tanacetum cinerariifolium]